MGTRKFRLLMSKYGFSIAIILIELFVIFGIILYLSQIAPIIWVTLVFLISVATVIAIVNRSMTPESKVTWLIVTFVPVFGPLLYLMFGERRLSKKELKQLQELNSIAFHENNGRQLHLQLQETDKSAYGIINALLHMDSNAEVYDQTDSQFFASGEEMWQQMLEDLKRAEKFIFLEYYIVDEGLMWDSILKILEEKAAQGVEVKMLYDDIGPHVLAVSEDESCYLQSDLGDTSLFDAIRGGRDAGGRYNLAEQELLRRTIRELPNIQLRGARGLDFSNCYPQPEFDQEGVLFDLNYFKYCFLKVTELDFHELKLEANFRMFAKDLTSENMDSFLYRDFQARNVMLKDGQPYFIDFQGGRKGPFYYDLASFCGRQVQDILSSYVVN